MYLCRFIFLGVWLTVYPFSKASSIYCFLLSPTLFRNYKKGRQSSQRCLFTDELQRDRWFLSMRMDTMSSEESGFEGDKVIVVKTLLWRSDTVSQMFKRLDDKITSEQLSQAWRQVKTCVYSTQSSTSSKPFLGDLPKWLFKDWPWHPLQVLSYQPMYYVNSCPQQPHHVIHTTYGITPIITCSIIINLWCSHGMLLYTWDYDCVRMCVPSHSYLFPVHVYVRLELLISCIYWSIIRFQKVECQICNHVHITTNNPKCMQVK